MANYEDRGLLFAGDAYVSTVENGVARDIVGRVNMTGVRITPPAVTTKNRTSRQRDTYGQALDTYNEPSEPASLEIQYDSMTALPLADALGASMETRETSAAEVKVFQAPEEINVNLAKDEWVDTGYLFLSSVTISGETEDVDFVVDYEGGRIMSINDGLSGATTVEIKSDGLKIDLEEGAWTRLPHEDVENFSISGLEEGVDYELSAAAGLVKALRPSAAGKDKVSTYEIQGGTETVYLGATETQMSRHILIDGVNLVTDQKVVLEVFEAVFSASQVMDLLSGEFAEGLLSGAMKTPAGKKSPYELRIKNK